MTLIMWLVGAVVLWILAYVLAARFMSRRMPSVMLSVATATAFVAQVGVFALRIVTIDWEAAAGVAAETRWQKLSVILGALAANEWGHVVSVTIWLTWGLFAFAYLTRAGIIARATTMESVRQPLFTLLMVLAIVFMVLLTFLPQFTMGDDLKSFKDNGLSTILISGLLLAIWTASTSIAQEIEGRTAMTLLSKPINRRQFIVGKFFGILHTMLLLVIPLLIVFFVLIFYKVGYDQRESSKPVSVYIDLETYRPDPVRTQEVLQVIPPTALMLFEITVLAAVSVAISTRAPMVVNMTSCFAIFVVAHLAPVLVLHQAEGFEPVQFVARLIAIFLPALEFFNTQAAVATNKIISPEYLGYSLFYCAAYSTAALLLAFILFEDRDLA